MDLLVNLYQKKLNDLKIEPKDNSIKVKRILSPNSDQLVSFIKKHFTDGWASEVKAGIYKPQPTCFIATKDNEIIGFACYDVTAKGFFGPTGINKDFRGLNIGQELLIETLKAMKEAGYGYAIIGGTTDALSNFYGKYIDLIKVDNEDNIYSRLVNK